MSIVPPAFRIPMRDHARLEFKEEIMKTRDLVLISTTLIALIGGPARADDVKAGDLVISQPWSRATPRGATVASGYLTIENKGSAADRLLGGSAEVAAKVDVHQMAM